MNEICFAGCLDIKKGRIWIPPVGKPYWVIAGKHNAGPNLTDQEIEKYLGILRKSDG